MRVFTQRPPRDLLPPPPPPPSPSLPLGPAAAIYLCLIEPPLPLSHLLPGCVQSEVETVLEDLVPPDLLGVVRYDAERRVPSGAAGQ